MTKKMNVGFIGWRGMVGSVLIKRMKEENDFKLINPIFFSKKEQNKKKYMVLNNNQHKIKNSMNIKKLKKCDTIISCQGYNYTKNILQKLRNSNWNGYWIDSSSALRMSKDSTIILDPININQIKDDISNGIKNFIGGNCTVSLMLMALGKLLSNNFIDWITVMTYQSISGAGSKNVNEFLKQIEFLYNNIKNKLYNKKINILKINDEILSSMKNKKMPINNLEVPLICSLIPWIDSDIGNGISKEEWKGNQEINKILGRSHTNSNKIKIDGLCVRIGTMRCHSQALTIKLKKDISIKEIENIILSSHKWVKIIPNKLKETKYKLTPFNKTGKLTVSIGRLRKLSIGKKYLSAFTVGDQLLWGAAEPLRRMLKLLIKK